MDTTEKSAARHILLVSAVLFICTLFIFSGTLDCGFLNYDDPSYVTENRLVTGGFSGQALERVFSEQVMGNWHPLTMLSHMLDWQLFGSNPAGHHAVSLLWHSLNVVLLFCLLKKLGVVSWRAALVAVLFAWHPLRVESVVWISERKDVLSGFFFFLTLLCYTAYAKAAESRSRRTWYLACLATYALGLMSKPMLVTLPAVLLLVDLWPLGRIQFSDTEGRSWWPFLEPRKGYLLGLFLEKIPFAVLSVALAFVTLRTQEGATAEGIPMLSRVETALAAVPAYVAKTFYPAQLAPLYPMPEHSVPVQAALGGGLVIVIGCLAWWRRRTTPSLLVGWLWFLGMLVPVSGIVQVGVQSMADRYSYLPGIGLSLILVFLIPEEWGRSRLRYFYISAGSLFVMLLSYGTWKQVEHWQNNVTLWEHTVAVTEENPVARFTLANAYMSAGRLDEAEPLLAQLVVARPQLTRARINYAIILSLRGQKDLALAQFEVALAQTPNNAKLHLNIARVLLSLGRKEEALQHCQRALECDPENINAKNLMSEAAESS